jgi:uncharacterized membrane protein (UPF0127 family)
MRIVNRRTGIVLASDVGRATSFWRRLRGLIGRRRLRDGEALAIEPCSGIHTFFMRFPIDAVFLDGELRVVRAVRSMRPYRSARAREAMQVIELPAGTVLRTGTAEGDELAFVV